MTGIHAIVANFSPMPVVDSADITAYNTTASNITFTLNSSFFDATGAWVNLTNQSSTTDIISMKISDSIAKGSTKSVQLTDLTPGQSYLLNITPLNTSVSGGIPIIYTHNSLYTAPVPGITFVSATTGTAVSDPLYLANGQSIVIRANITNASTELKNETISWGSVHGSGFSASGGETPYPYNITLCAPAPNAAASITVTGTVGGVTKILNLSSWDSPPPPRRFPPVLPTGTWTMPTASSSTRTATAPSAPQPVSPPATAWQSLPPGQGRLHLRRLYTNEDNTWKWSFSDGIPGGMTLYTAWTATAGEWTNPVTAPVITTAITEFTVSPALTEAPPPIRRAARGYTPAEAGVTLFFRKW